MHRPMEELATSGFELRFDLAGRAAVRVAGGPVAPRHVEPVPPPAPWVIEARCGDAAGWLLAACARRPTPSGAARCSSARRARGRAAPAGGRRAQLAPLGADLLERLTHRLRTDVTTLQAVADGAVEGPLRARRPRAAARRARAHRPRGAAAAERRARGDGRARPRAPAARPSRSWRRCAPSSRPPAATPSVTGPQRRDAADAHPRPRLGGVRAACWRRPAARDVRSSDQTAGGWCVTAGPTGRPSSGPNARSATSSHVGPYRRCGGRFGGRDRPVRDATRRSPLHRHLADWNA